MTRGKWGWLSSFLLCEYNHPQDFILTGIRLVQYWVKPDSWSILLSLLLSLLPFLCFFHCELERLDNGKSLPFPWTEGREPLWAPQNRGSDLAVWLQLVSASQQSRGMGDEHVEELMLISLPPGERNGPSSPGAEQCPLSGSDRDLGNFSTGAHLVIYSSQAASAALPQPLLVLQTDKPKSLIWNAGSKTLEEFTQGLPVSPALLQLPSLPGRWRPSLKTPQGLNVPMLCLPPWLPIEKDYK